LTAAGKGILSPRHLKALYALSSSSAEVEAEVERRIGAGVMV
jgi:hypothetical protein